MKTSLLHLQDEGGGTTEGRDAEGEEGGAGGDPSV